MRERSKINTVRAVQLTSRHCTPQAYECEASLMKHESSKQCHNSVCRVLPVSLSLSLPLPLRLGEKILKGRLSFRGRRATTVAGRSPVLGAAACKHGAYFHNSRLQLRKL